ncbi:MAG: sigma factor-like helix-turn-helix DNA-binding protein [Acidimicrobiales bacterium]
MVDERSSRPGASGADWVDMARDVFARLEPRAQTILVERVFALDGSKPTLQELGDRFNLSRERVRQIESKALKALPRRAAISGELADVVGRVRDGLGLLFSVQELAAALDLELDATNMPIEVQLVLFFAGPYRLVGQTVVGSRFETALNEALRPVAQGPIPLEEVRASMRRASIGDNRHLSLLRDRHDLRVYGELVVPWSGSVGDKAALVLSLKQRLMTAEEIHEELGEGSLATLKNYLAGEPRFQRRGPHTWGLTEWGGDKYKSIAAEMADELRGLPNGMPVDRLKRLLDEKFAIRASSVEIMSATHPMFMRDGVWIRLRESDEPYIPDTALEEARDCVVIDGMWAWRHLVTHDTLRGSGHLIPEAFAASLRLSPRSRLAMETEFGTIPLYWPSQSPGIGSLRRVTDALGASIGDYLFVIPNDGRLDFELVRRTELEAAEPAKELLLRLGQVGDVHALLPACASAIGLPGYAQADEIEDLFNIRGDRDIRRLFSTVRRHMQGH